MNFINNLPITKIYARAARASSDILVLNLEVHRLLGSSVGGGHLISFETLTEFTEDVFYVEAVKCLLNL